MPATAVGGPGLTKVYLDAPLRLTELLPVILYDLDAAGKLFRITGSDSRRGRMRAGVKCSVKCSAKQSQCSQIAALIQASLPHAWAGSEAGGKLVLDGRTFRYLTVPNLGPDGEVLGGQGMALDVTETMDQESDYLRLLQRRNYLLSHLPGILVELDLEGRYTRFEGRILEDLGVTENQFLGQRLLDSYGDQPEVAEGLESVLKGERLVASFLAYRYDRWWDVHLAPLFNARGDIDGVAGIALDVTDKLAVAAAQHATELKSQFLAAMSHELRTPLNSVLGFTQLLEMGERREKELRYLDNIRRSGVHLLKLVSDLLDLAKIEAGKLDIEIGTISVLDAVKNAMEDMKPLATEQGLTLRTRVGAGLAVRADPLRLNQILLNLLSNAIKFTENGSVSVRASGDGVGTIRISVVDTGPGISEEDQARVWDEFTQLESPSQGQGGTGLGLPLSRRLAELMGGRLEMQSLVGKGSVFTLELASPDLA